MTSPEAAEEFSVILAGKLGVGKSSIFRRIQTGAFVETPASGGSVLRPSDGGLESYIYKTKLSDKNYTVTLWDTGGLERYHSMTANYFRYCNAVILVYDTSPNKEDTLFALREWISDVKTHSYFGERILFSLWANKVDVSDRDASKPPEVEAFLEEHGIPDSLYFRISARTGEKLMESFHKLIMYMDNCSLANSEQSEGTLLTPQRRRPSWKNRCLC